MHRVPLVLFVIFATADAYQDIGRAASTRQLISNHILPPGGHQDQHLSQGNRLGSVYDSVGTRLGRSVGPEIQKRFWWTSEDEEEGREEDVDENEEEDEDEEYGNRLFHKHKRCKKHKFWHKIKCWFKKHRKGCRCHKKKHKHKQKHYVHYHHVHVIHKHHKYLGKQDVFHHHGHQHVYHIYKKPRHYRHKHYY